MSAATVLRAPLYASARWMRWYLLAVYAVAVTAAVVASLYLHTAKWPLIVGGAMALGNLFLGMFLLAPALLLAIDARQLCLPGMQRDALLGMLLYGALALVVPILALSACGGDATAIGLMLSLATIGGTGFALLPRYLSIAACFLPMTLNTFGARFKLPHPGQPGFMPLWFGGLAVLCLACAACWRRELRAAEPYRQNWSRPLVQQFRHHRGGWNAWTGFIGGGQDIQDHRARQRPAWLQPRAELGDVGPRRPFRSLRVALGGMFVPQTWGSVLRQAGVLALSGLLVVLMLALQSSQKHGGGVVPGFLRSSGLGMVLWLGGFSASMLTLSVATHFHQRWQRPNAELSLLPLLPGLGDPRTQRRELLRAGLLPPLYMQLGLLAALLGIGGALGLRGADLLLLALSQLGGIGFMLAHALCTFGRRALPNWGTGVLAALGFSLAVSSLSLAAFGLFRQLSPSPAFGTVLVAGWVLYAAMLIWLGRRGWLGLARLPHPYLTL